jgi:gliding motility-associated-like protein
MMKTAYLLSLLLILSFCRAQAQINLLNGLVAYYPFNGDDKDHSGNNNNPAFDNAIPTAGPSGVPNTAYHFDGATTQMQIPNSPTLQFGRQLTIFARVKADGYFYGNCHGNNILSKGYDSSPNDEFALRYDDYLYSAGASCNGAGPDTLHENIDVYYSTSTLPYSPYIEKGNWYNITRVQDGNTLKLYINCELIITVPENPALFMSGPDSLYFGYYPNLAFPYWLNGDVDEIRLYNRALNTEEIQALNGCPVAPCWPNVADFSLTPPLCSGGSTIQAAAAYPDSISSIKWTLQDGTTGTNTTIDHTFASTGDYSVKMAVTYLSGCADSVTKVIPINNASVNTAVVQTKDTTICAGDSLLLNATPLGLSYCWTPVSTLTNSTIDTPRAGPTAKTTYFCNTVLPSTNMVLNGNFSLGDTDFVSDYYSVKSSNSGAEYYIGPSPSSWLSNLSNCPDHTSGTGNEMVVAGIGAYVKVWSQTLAVQPNTNYIFSTWIQSVSAQTPGILNFSVNGAAIGNPIVAPSSTCNWVQYSTVWNSGDSTNAVISLVSQNQINGSNFALDDIYFGPYTLNYDSVNISVAAYAPLQARTDTTICGTYNVPLSATGATFYSWSPGVNLSDSTIADPTAPTSQTTSYIVSGYNNPLCVRKDTVVVTDLPLPVFSLSNPVDADLCQGTAFSITANITGVPDTGMSYSWSSTDLGPNLSTQQTYNGTATKTDTFYVAVFDSVCKITDSLQTNLQVDTIPVLSLIKSNDIDCAMPQATLTASGGATYTWTPTSSISSGAGTASPIVDPMTTTTYTVTTINGACTTADSIEVNTDFKGQISTFSVPSAFTPNGDGINDCLKLQYWGAVSNFEFSIFNRWGQRVFYATSRDVCWDGTFNGQPQPPGAFVYEIKASSPCSASGYVFRKGTITLIR